MVAQQMLRAVRVQHLLVSTAVDVLTEMSHGPGITCVVSFGIVTCMRTELYMG